MPARCSRWRSRLATAAAGDDAKGVAFFESKIRPVLVERCQECHSAEAKKPKGGLRVDSRAGIRAGGDLGAGGRARRSRRQRALPGDLAGRRRHADAAEGRVAGDGRRRLPPVDRDGRARPAREYRQRQLRSSTRNRRDWWSLRPIKRPAVPRFRVHRLRGLGRRSTPSSWPNSRSTASSPRPRPTGARLIRRFSFDLLGLPPTPEEIARFEADRSPDAYERLVDRLLASPHYGER